MPVQWSRAQPESGMPVPNSEVFVVDDDPMVRSALARLIASAGYEVRAYASATEFLDGWKAACPSCVVLDLRLPDLDGMALHRWLKENDAGVQVIFMTGFGDIPTSVEAMKAGAFDFLSKPVTEEKLLSSIDAALTVAAKAHSEQQQTQDLMRRYESLTPREREVLRLVVGGRLNKHIARDLRISEKTVKVHRGRVMQKMGTRRVAELVLYAMRLGISVSPTTGEEGRRRSGA
jgi:FixJ family two-component response regulator